MTMGWICRLSVGLWGDGGVLRTICRTFHLSGASPRPRYSQIQRGASGWEVPRPHGANGCSEVQRNLTRLGPTWGNCGVEPGDMWGSGGRSA